MRIKQDYVIWILIAFFINIKTDDFHKDVANDVEKWFDTSNYDKNDKRPLPMGKNKKSTGSF